MNADLQSLLPFAASVTGGLLIGIALERSQPGRGWLRTAALVAMLGALCGFLTESAGSSGPVVAGLVTVGALLALGQGVGRMPQTDPGGSALVAILLAYAIGVAVWSGHAEVAMLAALIVAALVQFGQVGRRRSGEVGHAEALGALQFVLLALVGLPLLPDAGYGSHEVLEPFHIGLMTVLIAGARLVAHRLTGLATVRGGWALNACVRGMAGPLYVAIEYGRTAARDPARANSMAVADSLAQAGACLLTVVIVLLAAPQWTTIVLLFVGLQGLALAALGGWQCRSTRGQALAVACAQVPDPVTLGRLLVLAASYAILLQAAAVFVEPAGWSGTALFGGIAGFVNRDQSLLALTHLASPEEGDVLLLVVGVGSAVGGSLVMRAALAIWLGGRRYARCLLPQWLVCIVALGVASALAAVLGMAGPAG